VASSSSFTLLELALGTAGSEGAVAGPRGRGVEQGRTVDCRQALNHRQSCKAEWGFLGQSRATVSLPFPNSHLPHAPGPFPFQPRTSATFTSHVKAAVPGCDYRCNYSVQLSRDSFQGLCPSLVSPTSLCFLDLTGTRAGNLMRNQESMKLCRKNCS